MAVATWDRYRYWRLRAFRRRYELSVVQKIGLALGMAGFTGLVAQVRIPLPFTPVPITGSVFAVLLAGVMLGRWYGGLSQALYVGFGIAGLPWFTGWNGGLGYFLGGIATGGYLTGFVVAAFVIGWLTQRYVAIRSFVPLLLLMMVGVGIIYFFGALWFGLLASTGLASNLQAPLHPKFLEGMEAFGQGLGRGVAATLWMTVLPFIPLDLGKAVAVAAIAHALLPKTSYNGEVDAPRYARRNY